MLTEVREMNINTPKINHQLITFNKTGRVHQSPSPPPRSPSSDSRGRRCRSRPQPAAAGGPRARACGAAPDEEAWRRAGPACPARRRRPADIAPPPGGPAPPRSEAEFPPPAGTWHRVVSTSAWFISDASVELCFQS